jgi:FkbM family methyltransferase
VYRQLKDYGFPDGRIVRQTGFYEYFLGKMYFEKGIMVPHKNESFVDIGAYNMSNSIDFIHWCGGNYDSIIAFEADSVSYENCKKIIIEYELERCQVLNKAVYSCDTDLTFLSAPDGEYGGSRIDGNGEHTVKAVSLDNYFKKGTQSISIIKMDIEGAEKDALSGAKDIIRQSSPRLAVSAYHKPFDVVELTLYIHELNPEYKFYLRHHTLGIWDTVLYAVV